MDPVESKMALQAFGEKFQLINEDGVFSSAAQSFVDKLKEHSSSYTVVSIIGPQNGGKSTLLNTIFGTNFEVLKGIEMKQTTKGIWISACINPCMILMDVEGSDGCEREDKIFERQLALFALTVSDVLVLNMGYYAIGLNEAAGGGLLKLVFGERVLINEETKTKVVICVRDNPYENASDVITNQVTNKLDKLWKEAHQANKSDKSMSDYIEIIVRDFPCAILENKKEKFKQKCHDLAKFLCTIATSNNEGTKNSPSRFAFSTEKIWNLIRENPRLSAADYKEAMSSYVCDVVTKNILESIDSRMEYKSLMEVEPNNLEEFNKQLSSFLDILLREFDDETEFAQNGVREDKKKLLERSLFEKIDPIFQTRILGAWVAMASSVQSEVHANLAKIRTLKDLTDILDSCMKKFDESCGDVHPLFQSSFVQHREAIKRNIENTIEQQETYMSQKFDEIKQRYELEKQLAIDNLEFELKQKHQEEVHRMEKERMELQHRLDQEVEKEKQTALQNSIIELQKRHEIERHRSEKEFEELRHKLVEEEDKKRLLEMEKLVNDMEKQIALQNSMNELEKRHQNEQHRNEKEIEELRHKLAEEHDKGRLLEMERRLREQEMMTPQRQIIAREQLLQMHPLAPLCAML